MDLVARIDGVDAGSSNLIGKSEVTMSGKAAAFGGRMMNSVADQILKQFADNFATQVAALAAQRSAVAAPTLAPSPQSAPVAASSPPPPPLPVARELNGIALMWAALKDWLRGLFGKRQA